MTRGLSPASSQVTVMVRRSPCGVSRHTRLGDGGLQMTVDGVTPVELAITAVEDQIGRLPILTRLLSPLALGDAVRVERKRGR